jgi:hypothetical protein
MVEREARLAAHQRMAEMFQYMQSLLAPHRVSLRHLHCSLQTAVDPALFHTPVSIKIVVTCW